MSTFVPTLEARSILRSLAIQDAAFGMTPTMAVGSSPNPGRAQRTVVGASTNPRAS